MKVLLAVSGGIDSMYMLHRAPELFPGASFAVAHCNFGLRGAESDGDEEFVRRECAKLGIECYVHHFQTVEYASSNGISIEMAARELRYSWFDELPQSPSGNRHQGTPGNSPGLRFAAGSSRNFSFASSLPLRCACGPLPFTWPRAAMVPGRTSGFNGGRGITARKAFVGLFEGGYPGMDGGQGLRMEGGQHEQT